MNSFLQDVRYGWRQLGRNRAVALVVVLSLALGIGANTMIFTFINALLLRPLPLEDLPRLVRVFTTNVKNGGKTSTGALPVSYLNYRDFGDRNRVFSELMAFAAVPMNLTLGGGEAEEVSGFLVTGNYFETLGLAPFLGRFFLPEEDRTPGTHPVAVLGYRLWQNRFGANRDLLGKTVQLSGRKFTIIGIAPESFNGLNVGVPFDVAVPMMMHDEILSGRARENFKQRRGLLLSVVGRLEPGVTPAQARSDLVEIAAQLEREHPDDNQGRSVRLAPLAESTIPLNMRTPALLASVLLMTVVGLVLLIACANVANLMLARANARRGEIALRLSLGAERGRLIRQVLSENLLLFLLGGALGLLVGVWFRQILWALRPSYLPAHSLDLSVDGRVLAFTAGLTFLVGLLSGLVPAFRLSRTDLRTALGDRAPSGTAKPGGRSRDLLITAQVALSTFSLAIGVFFLQSLDNALRLDPGFDTRNVFMLTFNVGAQGYSEERGRQLYQRVVEEVRALPETRAAALAESLPFFGGNFKGKTLAAAGRDAESQKGVVIQSQAIGEGYLQTLGIPLLRGRDFLASDHAESTPVVIVNDTMANRFWPGEEAVGARIQFASEDVPREVIGVAKDSKYNTIGEDPQPLLYLPLSQHFTTPITLFVNGPSARVLGSVQRQVQALDPSLPLRNVWTMSEVMNNSLWAPRIGAMLLTLLGLLSLALAAIGIYGVTRYSVSQRQRDISIRMAIGARGTDVVSLFVAQILWRVLAGMALGLGGAFLAGRTLSSLFYGVGVTGLGSLAMTGLILVLAAVAASYLPARRATRIDPIAVLRSE